VAVFAHRKTMVAFLCTCDGRTSRTLGRCLGNFRVARYPSVTLFFHFCFLVGLAAIRCAIPFDLITLLVEPTMLGGRWPFES
jgi:hypothetical protein